jgi:methylated-DNA-[protein]-cysteine S-methyltransferase
MSTEDPDTTRDDTPAELRGVDTVLRGTATTPDADGPRSADAAPTGADPAWESARTRFVARAAAERLVDVGYEDHETPLGTVRIGATAQGIVRLLLPSEDHDAGLQELADRVSPRIVRGGTPAIATARHELDEYFAGHRRTFDVPLDWSLTRAFRREVLVATAAIPYGRTSSYRGVATAAGSPNAVRAAGSALATNPIPILVPCHRVLRSDGGLGQYRGGTEAKQRLLALESAA